jgi:hypothetical protein
MKDLKLLSFYILSTVILFTCSGNIRAKSSKESTSTTSANGTAPATSGSSNDMYYELTTTSTGKNMSINEVTMMFVSSRGDMRLEMSTVSSLKGNKSTAPIVIIGHSDKPDESISIDGSTKTYSINHFKPEDFNTGQKITSTVTKIGEEKILGFNSVHVRIISNKSMGSFYNSVDTIDIWRSKDVTMQASVKDLMSQFESRTGNFMYSKEVTDQLKQMGCEGFMVKMKMGSKDVSMIFQLTKVEHRDLPSSMFQIPAGYTEDKNGM